MSIEKRDEKRAIILAEMCRIWEKFSAGTSGGKGEFGVFLEDAVGGADAAGKRVRWS